jgi:hypothetical protein
MKTLSAALGGDLATLPPCRPVLETLPQCRGTNTSRRTPAQREELLTFVAEQYDAGRSLRELAELTGRTQTAIRQALDEARIHRRPPCAYHASAHQAP